MTTSLPRNRALAQILNKMIEVRTQAGDWVEKDAQFDPESAHLMGVMNQADLTSVKAFADWVEMLEDDLPITVSSSDGGRTFAIEIDQQGRTALSSRNRDLFDTMAWMLFGGPEPGPENTAADDLTGLGLPEQLRRDLSDS
jgi:hypothetical protein